jgi:hypothetical protein
LNLIDVNQSKKHFADLKKGDIVTVLEYSKPDHNYLYDAVAKGECRTIKIVKPCPLFKNKNICGSCCTNGTRIEITTSKGSQIGCCYLILGNESGKRIRS